MLATIVRHRLPVCFPETPTHFTFVFFFFFFNDTATTEIYTLSLHDALPILMKSRERERRARFTYWRYCERSEEHTSELQSLRHLVCRLLLEKRKTAIHNRCAVSPTQRTSLPPDGCRST